MVLNWKKFEFGDYLYELTIITYKKTTKQKEFYFVNEETQVFYSLHDVKEYLDRRFPKPTKRRVVYKSKDEIIWKYPSLGWKFDEAIPYKVEYEVILKRYKNVPFE